MSRVPHTSEATAPPVKAFGPTALATPANAVTIARLIAAPLFAIYVARSGPTGWLMWVLWTVLAFSDGLDGRIARWHGTTRSGAFLDPLADKFLVIGALAALADLRAVSLIAVVIITVRELVMSLYRIAASRQGISIPARSSAKLKTLLQDVAIGLSFAPIVGRHHMDIAQAVLWVAVALTVITGVQYVQDGRKLAAEHRGRGNGHAS